MWRWLSRCVPGISIIVLLLLLLFAFPDTAKWSPNLPWPGRVPTQPPVDHGSGKTPPPLSLAQKIFIAYTLIVHVNAQTFAMRLSWALCRLLKETRAVLRRRPSAKNIVHADGNETPQFADSPLATPTSPSSPQATTFDDLGRLEEGEDGEVVHAIILPNYCEDLDTLQTTLSVLASHPRAAAQYEVRRATQPV